METKNVQSDTPSPNNARAGTDASAAESVSRRDWPTWVNVAHVTATVLSIIGSVYFGRDVYESVESLSGRTDDVRTDIAAVKGQLAGAESTVADLRSLSDSLRKSIDREFEEFERLVLQRSDELQNQIKLSLREVRLEGDSVAQDAKRALEDGALAASAELREIARRQAEEFVSKLSHLEAEIRLQETQLEELRRRFGAEEMRHDINKERAASPAVLQQFACLLGSGRATLEHEDTVFVKLRDGRFVKLPVWRPWARVTAPVSLSELHRAGVLADYEIFLAIVAGLNRDANGWNDRAGTISLDQPESTLRSLFDDFVELAPHWVRAGRLRP